MIAADTLARELGCTLSDLEDLDGTGRKIKPHMLFMDSLADVLRREWAQRNPTPFPVRPDRVAAQHALNEARADYITAWRKWSAARMKWLAESHRQGEIDTHSTAGNRFYVTTDAMQEAAKAVHRAEDVLARVLAS